MNFIIVLMSFYLQFSTTYIHCMCYPWWRHQKYLPGQSKINQTCWQQYGCLHRWLAAIDCNRCVAKTFDLALIHQARVSGQVIMTLPSHSAPYYMCCSHFPFILQRFFIGTPPWSLGWLIDMPMSLRTSISPFKSITESYWGVTCVVAEGRGGGSERGSESMLHMYVVIFTKGLCV